MKITDLLGKSVRLNQSASSKEEVLKMMVDLMSEKGNISDKEDYLKAVMAREKEGTTGVGDGIAIPHGRCSGVKEPGLAAMVLPAGVEYEALDDELVNLIFLIAAPEGGGDAHIEMLSKLSTMLMNDEFTRRLKNAKTTEEFLKVIDDAENEKDSLELSNENVEISIDKCYIVAVTACPTGIAHTYMAAEALEKKAKELGCQIKVETRGGSVK